MNKKTRKKLNICRKKTIKKKDVDKIKKINKEYRNNLDKKTINALSKEFRSRFLRDFTTISSSKNKFTYYFSINKNDNFGIYYYKKNGIESSKSNILINCKEMAKNKSYFKMNEIDVSNDENYIAFSVDYKGNNETTLYLKEIDSDKLTIVSKKAGENYCISPNSKYLYYTVCDNTGKPYKLYSYNIHDKKSKLIYTETDVSNYISVGKTSDNLYCLLKTETKVYSNFFLLDDNNYSVLFKNQTEKMYSIDHYLNKWFVLIKDETNKIHETNDFIKFDVCVRYIKNITYEYMLIKGNKLIIGVRENGYSYFMIKDLCTNKIVKLKLSPIRYDVTFPELFNLNMFSSKLNVKINTFLQPPKSIEIDLDSFKINELKSYKNKNYNPNIYDESIIKVKNDLYMTIMYKKSLFKKNMKCLLKGYGSYGAVEDPSFNYCFQSLLDRGFIICIAHIRGGGFMGRKWYNDGKMFKKMNTFKDFITCAEFLIDKKYTSSEKMAIWGRSAGGLLIGATINMRPELFKLAILGVPFVDVITTMSDKCGPLTREEYHEFGNANIKKVRDYMMKYSPIDNIDYTNNYPNIFIYSNIDDTQVLYSEPYKYYHKIKESNIFKSNNKDLLMNIKLKYGHGQSSKRYESIVEMAEIYSLIIKYIN